jgi:hypothetical protein
MLKNFNKNYRNNQNISIFTSISYHSVFTRPPFLFFQHNQQYDTLLPIVPCTHKLKAGITYSLVKTTFVHDIHFQSEKTNLLVVLTNLFLQCSLLVKLISRQILVCAASICDSFCINFVVSLKTRKIFILCL